MSIQKVKELQGFHVSSKFVRASVKGELDERIIVATGGLKNILGAAAFTYPQKSQAIKQQILFNAQTEISSTKKAIKAKYTLWQFIVYYHLELGNIQITPLLGK